MEARKPVVVLGGVGPKSFLSSCLIEHLSKNFTVVAIARSEKTLSEVKSQCKNLESTHFISVDLNDARKVRTVIDQLENELGEIECYIHLAGKIQLSGFLETTYEDFKSSIDVNFLSAVLISQAVLPKMLDRKKGSLIFTGATASTRGGARSSAFASGKFALRGLAQSLAREFSPKGIHVAHLILDGMILGDRAQKQFKKSLEDSMDPMAIAEVYLNLINQKQSAWAFEMDLRPAKEKF